MSEKKVVMTIVCLLLARMVVEGVGTLNAYLQVYSEPYRVATAVATSSLAFTVLAFCVAVVYNWRVK